MNTTIKTSLLLISLTSVSLLSGCMTPGKHVLAHGELTMAQIYRVQTGLAMPAQTQMKGQRTSRRAAISAGNFRASASGMSMNTAYTDVAQHQINSEFKLLPNPNIAAYIFPHLSHYSGTNVPVPGYTTTFFLYEKNHYAMPGEMY